MFMLGSLVSLILVIWIVARIWKDSAILAIVCFFFPPALIFPLVKYWGDEEHDIKVPFFIYIPVFFFTWYEMYQTFRVVQEEQESLLAVLQFFA